MAQRTNLLPKVYIPLYESSSFDSPHSNPPPPILLKRRYSADRVVDKPGPLTMQKAGKMAEVLRIQRRELHHRLITQEETSTMRRLTSGSKRDRKVESVHDWKAEGESFTFNIRPGRHMFPFISNNSLYKKRRTEDVCDVCNEPLTLPRNSTAWMVDPVARPVWFKDEYDCSSDRLWEEAHEQR